MKEFGGERVCINDDDVLPVKSMALDPLFFAQLCSVDDLEGFKSNREDMCYSLINLNQDTDFAYCVSQGKAIRINQKTIRATNIEEALDFAVSSDMSGNEVICSSCLYKYLVTLTDLFEDLLSEEEKGDLILSYSQDLINSIVSQLSQEGVLQNTNRLKSEREIIENQIEHLAIGRKQLGLISLDTDSPEIKGNFDVLLRVHKTLSRLESIFLFQVLSLHEAEDELTALTLLKFMVETADRILSTHDDIRSQRSALINFGISIETLDDLLDEREIHRRHAEKRFRNLLSLLSKVSSRPS
jgi:hypothetical protein